MSVSELRAAREWCDGLGLLLTPGLVLAVGLLANPELPTVPDTVRADLIAAAWGDR